MSPRLVRLGVVIAGWLVFLLAVGIPTLGLLAQLLQQGAPAEGFTFSGRQWGLLGKTAALASAGAAACLLMSAPAVYALAHGVRPASAAILGVCLLCPPMVYVFAWQRLVPFMEPHVMCIALWAGWAWPIPAVLIGNAWRSAGRSVHDAARLDAGSWTALRLVGLPAVRTRVAVGLILLLALFLGDYGVPHACGLTVFATELLTTAEGSHRAIDTVWPAMPVTALLLVALAIAWALVRRERGRGRPGATGHEARGFTPLVVLWSLFLVSWAAPMVTLTTKLGSWAAFGEAVRTYRHDLLISVGVAGLGGVLSVIMATGIVAAGSCSPARASARIAGFGAAWALLLGVLPGGIAGLGLIAAYNRDVTAALVDHWPIIAVGHVTRFSWLAMLAALFSAKRGGAELVEQARVDGADRGATFAWIVLPLRRADLIAAGAVTAVLALGDVAGMTLIRVPDFAPIALVLIEKFHRFENAMLISLSLWLAGLAGAGALIATTALRLRRTSTP